jgi:hypothetical protein
MAFKLVGIPGPRDVDKSTWQIGRTKTSYSDALRSAVKSILSDGPREIHVFQGPTKVAVCEAQDRNVRGRGRKFSVVCSGEKPAKRRR